MLLFEVLKGN